MEDSTYNWLTQKNLNSFFTKLCDNVKKKINNSIWQGRNKTRTKESNSNWQTHKRDWFPFLGLFWKEGVCVPGKRQGGNRGNGFTQNKSKIYVKVGVRRMQQINNADQAHQPPSGTFPKTQQNIVHPNRQSENKYTERSLNAMPLKTKQPMYLKTELVTSHNVQHEALSETNVSISNIVFYGNVI